ncbi:MAG: hypothetical protein ACJ786_12795, partial [Catenulispora sp.]
SGGTGGMGGSNIPAPPQTWKEHWFEHDQTLQLYAYNDDVALYFDDDVDRTHADWMLPFDTSMWRYVKKTYGDFGAENRLYLIYHQGRYSGGHPSTYLDESHDFRNVSDVGPGPWATGTGGELDLHSHETGHVVEIASRNVLGSPAFPLWGDSKWAEFFQYDLYIGLGLTADAQRLFDKFTNTSDGFPVAGTHWFRDWFHPLWRDYGHAQIMVRYFQLLAQYFPKNGNSYARDLNWGEYIHFMSGAAHTNLKPLATKAFSWPSDWEQQLNKARSDFPKIQY